MPFFIGHICRHSRICIQRDTDKDSIMAWNIKHPSDEFSSLREENYQILSGLLDKVAVIAMTLGTLSTIGSVFRASTQGWHPNIIVDIVFFLVLILLLLFRKRVPFSRITAMIFIVAGLNAVVNFINLGLATVSFVILTTCCVLTGVFFGFRIGLWSLLASIIIVGCIGVLVTTGRLRTMPDVESYLLSPETWITQMAGYAVFVIILLTTVHRIQSRLWQSFMDLRKKSVTLHEREERYRHLAENMRDVLFVQDTDLKFLYQSHSVNQMFGYTVEEIMPLRMENLMTPASWAEARDFFKTWLERCREINEEVPLMEFEYVRKNGTTFWGELKLTFLRDSTGKIAGLQGTLRDISKRKAAEIQVQQDLEEKNVLLQEIHHRVKNNLNVITSLLSLQAGRVGADPAVLKAFRESRDRIHAMAMVHERLYHSDDLKRIDIKLYFEAMSRNLLLVHGAVDRVKLHIDVQGVFLDINMAIPCGLILNELITNALKYAFPGNAKGRIRVTFRQEKSGDNRFVVSDNGIGIPVNVSKTESLGLHLVHILTEQLDGVLRIERIRGSRFIIKFPGISS